MKHRNVKADLDTIIPLLIQEWRKLRKLQGPLDRLQTREFRGVVEGIQQYQNSTRDRKSFDAYMLYYWPLFYQEALSVIGELPQTPKRVLEISTDLAPMAFAALRHGAQEAFATGADLDILRLGAKICGQYGLSLSVRKWDSKKERCPIEGKFDLIILGHCLSDLCTNLQDQIKYLQSLTKLLSEEGFLLLVDSSLPHVNEEYLRLRDALVKEGYPVQAPCVWKGKCPALEAKSQCYAQRELDKHPLISEFHRSAKINLGSLKMTYLIFRHPKSAYPEIPDKRYYRIISPPFDSIRGRTFYLCGVDGKRKLSSQIEKLPKEARAFDYLKRGELISIEDVHENNTSLEIVEETKVLVEASLGKPLPEKQVEEWNEF